MKKIKLIIEYDGTGYSGWQRQKNALSVQQVVEEAWELVSGEKVCVQGAGRTDAGVHALGQTAHFVTGCSIPPEKIAFALNTKLPRDIRIRKSEEAAERFHATLDARIKHYRYVIYNDVHDNAVLNRYSAHVYYSLDVALMEKAAEDLLGKHDFAAFSSAGSDIKTTERIIYKAEITRKDRYILIDIWGNGFLYNMVRIIAGTLADIGSGKLEPSVIKDAFIKKDRVLVGKTMPAKGLTMMEVLYDEDLKEPDGTGLLEEYQKFQIKPLTPNF